MIDIGLNLTSPQFAGEQADLVARARTAGVEALILTGTDLAGSRESATLAAEWPGYCFSTAGVHPHDAKSVDEQTLPALRALAALPQVVAIGECGLDYNRDFSPRPVQDAVFDAQLALAAELGMPVFLHCRDAHGHHHRLAPERAALCHPAQHHEGQEKAFGHHHPCRSRRGCCAPPENPESGRATCAPSWHQSARCGHSGR